MKDKISRRFGDALTSQYTTLDLKQDIGKLTSFPFLEEAIVAMYYYHIHCLPHRENHLCDHHSHHNNEKPWMLLLLLATMDF
jgi:hypothetical protein